MSTLSKQITLLFNRRKPVERAIITALVALLIFFAWLSLLTHPFSQKIKETDEKITRVKENIANITLDLGRYTKISMSPTPDTLKQIAGLEVELAAAEKHPLLTRKIITTPEDLKALTEELSQVGKMLSLNKVQTAEPTPITPSDATQPQQFSDQKIVITLHGGYFDTIHYLEYIESLPWHLSFESMDYKVKEYPNAKVTITLNALAKK